jgi:hypothetical protein
MWREGVARHLGNVSPFAPEVGKHTREQSYSIIALRTPARTIEDVDNELLSKAADVMNQMTQEQLLEEFTFEMDDDPFAGGQPIVPVNVEAEEGWQ